LARQESGLLAEPERISEDEDSIVDDNELSPSSEKVGDQ
jgi:hypothetical protein